MKDFSELKKNLKKDLSSLNPIKIALLGDNATQLLQIALKGMGYEYGYNLEIFEADFDQVERQVFDLSSALHAFNPEIVIIFKSSQKLLEKYHRTKASQQKYFGSKELKNIKSIYFMLTNSMNARIIHYNFPEIDDSVFGSYANKNTSSFLFQLRKLNFDLMQLAPAHPNLYLCDLSSVQNQVGRKAFFRPSLYYTTEMVLSPDVLPLVASKTMDIINSLNGRMKKCIILDLDNTVWGGIIGDDGIENIQLGDLGIGKAFTAFQHWIKKLKNRGIIIAVCSKNTESIAKEPFEKHPDMLLKLDDISVFLANWKSKDENIRTIQSILNIGFDSMVFIDDNPFERELVRKSIPGISIPEMPDDPADFLEYLQGLNLFETTTLSEEDKNRTRLYQIEAERSSIKGQFANENDYLQSLSMKSVVQPFNKFNIPRAAQLTKRSNQFNLRTVRYTEAEIELLEKNKDYFSFTFTLEDKFGDYGLVAVVILKKTDSETLFIDTWVMSCRVLQRGMEEFILNTILDFTGSNGFSKLKGEYIPTIKNEIVKDLFLSLGFEKEHEQWVLKTDTVFKKTNFIKLKKQMHEKG